MRILSLLAISLILPISAWSKDGIQFWSQPQTCPGKNLEIKVERQKQWDQHSRTWISAPSSLGKFRIFVYRHDPTAKFFSARFSAGKGASWVDPKGHPKNGELLFAPVESRYPVSGVGSPIVIALGNPKEKKQEKRDFQNVWVWPKRIDLPPSAQVFEGEQDASASAKLLIPAQSPGTYIVEIQQGEARAFLPWRVSDLALRVERIENRVVFHALRASDGAPIPDGQLKVRIRTRDEQDWQKQTIDEKNLGMNRIGMVELPLGKRQSLFEAELHARDECLRTEFDEDSLLWGRSNYEERPEAKPNMAFAYTDRPVYKPGDELFVKMVMYSTDLDPDRDLVSVYSSISTGSNERPFASRNWDRDESSSDSPRTRRSIPFPGMESLGLEYSISGPPMPRQLTGVAALLGGSPLRFAGGLKLPSSLKPGSYTLNVAQGGSRIHFNPVKFEVQDYEKPRFSIRILEPTSHKEREGLNFTVEAKGVDGNPVSGARGQWNLFRLSRRQEKTWFDAGPALELKSRGELSCDAKGAAPLHLPSNLVDASSEYRLLVKLTDLSGQRRMASHTIGKNSGAVRIVLDRCFAMLGEGVRMGAEVDGKASLLKLEVFEAKSPEMSFWTEPSHLTCGEKVLDVDPSGAFIRLKAGVYLIQATAQMTTGEKLQDRRAFVVGDEKVSLPTSDRLRATLDGRTLLPGGKARVLAVLPKAGLTLQWRIQGRNSLRRAERKIEGTTAVIEIPLDETLYPNGWIVLSTLCDGRHFEQTLPIQMDLGRDRLNISLRPSSASLRPGQDTSLNIESTDDHGRLVDSNVSVSLVDEALFLLAPENLGDPISFFHPDSESSITTLGSLQNFVIDNLSGEVLEDAYRYGIRGSGGGGGLGSLPRPQAPELSPEFRDLRDHFLDSALWIPDLDLYGKGKVEVHLPDDLTSWRATAVSFSSDMKAGIGRTTLTVSKPLELNLAVPKVLAEGDEGRALAIVRNLGNKELNGNVRITVEDAQCPEMGKVFSLKAGETCRLSFPIKATPGSKEATIQARAESGVLKDGEKRTISILPATFELRSSGFESLDPKGTSVTIPPLCGGEGPVTVSLFAADNTLERLMRPSLHYLMEYPYGCVEQTLSRFVPNVIIQDLVNRGMLPPLPENETKSLEKNVQAGLQRLSELRIYSKVGGWGWYGPSDFQGRPDAVMTAYALSSLASLRKLKGAEHDSFGDLHQIGLPLLKKCLEAQTSNPEIDKEVAFLLYAFAEDTSSVFAKYREEADQELDKAITRQLGRTSPSPGALALLALAAGGRGHARLPELLDRLETSCILANGRACWKDEKGFLSGVMPTVLAVKALCRHRLASPLIAPTESYLVSCFDGKGWGSTWATAQVLALLPDLARVRRLKWMGGPDIQLAMEGRLEHDFKTQENPLTITLPEGKDLTLKLKGQGLLLWSQQAGSSKPLTGPRLGEALLDVKRELFQLDLPKDSTRIGEGYLKAPWTGNLNLDAEALLEVHLRSSQNVNYALVEIPIPAGLEADARLEDCIIEGKQITQTTWSHPETHPDRVAFLIQSLKAGEPQTLRLRLRARTEGRYTLRPVKFSLMGDENQWATSEACELSIRKGDQP